MFCEKCGRELQEGWVQCPYCGTKVGDAGNTGPVILKKPAGEKGEELSGNDGAGQEDAHAPSGWDQEIRTDGAGPNMHPAREKASRRGIWKYVFFAVAILAVIGIVSSPGTPEPSEDGNPAVSEISRHSETVESVAADLPVTAEERQDLSDMDLEILLGQSEEKLKDAGFTSEAEAVGYQMMNGAVFADSEDGVVALVSILESGDGLPGFHNVKTGMSQEDADRLLGDAYVHAGQQGNEIYYAETHAGIAVVLTVEDGKVTAIQAAKLSEEEMRDLQTAAAQEETAQSGTGQEETARSEAGQENDGEESTDSEFIFPDSDKRYLTEEEIRGVDAELLSVGRNEIFARHGYIFKTENLQEYFESTSWYEGTVQGDEFDSEEEFNDYEKKNVEMIKQMENEGDTQLWEGDYYKTDFDSDRAGVAWIYYEGSDGVEMTVGTEPESDSMTLYGRRKNDGTMVLTDEYDSVTVTLTPDGDRAFTLKSTELPEGMDAGLFEDLLNGRYEHGEVS